MKPPETRPPAPAPESFGDEDLQPIYRLVDLLYETVEHPDRLRDALSALAELSGVGSILLLATQGRERRLLAAGRALLGHSDSTSVAVHLRSDRTRTIPLDGGFEMVLDQDELSPRALAALTRIAPHLARALRLSDRLGMAERGDPNRVAALERLPLALLLLDGTGRLVYLSHAARTVLAGASSLHLEDHQLVAKQAVSRALLETLLERVLAAPAASREFVGGRMSLPDESWKHLDVLVAPYRTWIEKSEVRGVVFLSVPGSVKSPEEQLMERYALTPEESWAVGDLMAGREPAEAQGQARSRQLVGALYRKLGTTRQADLIRLLLRPPGVLFEPEAIRSRTL